MRGTAHDPQRKQSPSPSRGGGLTTAVAGCRSHGFEVDQTGAAHHGDLLSMLDER